MSRAEEITSEVRRLVLTCRAMESQLQQSIPKKTHQEMMARMQATIDGLNSEVERVRGEYQKTIAVNETVARLSGHLAVQSETISSLVQAITSQSQAIESQRGSVEALSSSLSQSTVPVLLYEQALAKSNELEERIRDMVEKAEYISLQRKCDDLGETLRSTVPKEDYIALQSQFVNYVPKESFEALQRTLSQYVPREQLVASENRVRELETKLEHSVPRSDYEELTGRIALLTKDAPALTVSIVPMESGQIVEPLAETVSKLTEPVVVQPEYEKAEVVPEVVEQVGTIDIGPAQMPSPPVREAPQSESSDTPFASPDIAAVETPRFEEGTQTSGEGGVDTSARPPQSSTEITEIQSQLSEIKGAQETGATPIQIRIVDSGIGFLFSNTELCARSGLEFIEDLEQAPIETIQDHMRSGDFERWFKDALCDDVSAESLKSIREGNCAGEELRAKIVSVISTRYKP